MYYEVKYAQNQCVQVTCSSYDGGRLISVFRDG